MAILFLDDWKSYPDAIIDTQTTNRTAVEMAAKLRQMGIKNHAFFLALHNPELQGVDPFDPNLTEKQMLAIGVEIRNNPWYYFREVGRVPASSGGEGGKHLEFNRANIALWWCFLNHITTILTQPRQTGKSFCSDYLSTYLMNFACSHTTIHLLTKDDKLRGENIDRLKKIYGELPPYLNFKTREDANNTEELTIKRLGNAFKTHVPQAEAKNANNLGRGMSTPILITDEGPFQKNLDIALGAAVGAMGARIDEAKLNGAPYGLLFTTTAGRKDEKEGAYFYSMIEASAPFTERFYDASNAEDLEARVRKVGKGHFRTYVCFSHTQLGKDDKWLHDKITAVPMTPEAINRDFFNVWTSGNSSSPFPVDILERITRSERDPEYASLEKHGYMLRWYIPENQITSYMLSNDTTAGLDTSDAVGSDDISIVFTSVRTGAVVAAGHFNETNLISFAMFLVDMMALYPRWTLVPERRSSAVTIIDYLIKFLPQRKIDPFKRIFNWVVNSPNEYKDRYAEARMPLSARTEEIHNRSRKYFGFATSAGGATSRNELFTSTLLAAVKRNADSIYDKKLGGQLRGLQVKNGRVDHATGEHDDHVVAWLLDHWFLTKGENLAYYGIDMSQGVLVQTVVKVGPRAVEDQLQDYLQLQIRNRVNHLFELMTAENNEHLLIRYEQELRQLDRQLILNETESFSVDMFLNELKEKRKQKRPRQDQSISDGTIARAMGYFDGTVDRRKLSAGTVVL
jgi:hypothetical protein